MAFFEPLDHLITSCPLSIQKRERMGRFLTGEEPDPFIPTYDNEHQMFNKMPKSALSVHSLWLTSCLDNLDSCCIIQKGFTD